MIAAGVVAAIVAGAGIFLATRAGESEVGSGSGDGASSSKKKKKKKKAKKKAKKEEPADAQTAMKDPVEKKSEANQAESSDAKAIAAEQDKVKDDADAKSASTDAKTSADSSLVPDSAEPAKDLAETEASAPEAVAKQSTPVMTVASPQDALLGIARNKEGLQTSGPVSVNQLQKFFEASNKLLEKQSVKDSLAKAYKEGKDITQLLKEEQERIWGEFRIEPQYGFKQIQVTCNDPGRMPLELREALVQAAAAEESILTYAILGSQERFDQEREKVKNLYVEAVEEMKQEMEEVGAQGQVAAENYAKRIIGEFQNVVSGMENLDAIERLKRRQELSNDEFKIIVKGEQYMMYQQQAAQMQAMGMMPPRS